MSPNNGEIQAPEDGKRMRRSNPELHALYQDLQSWHRHRSAGKPVIDYLIGQIESFILEA